MEEYIMPIMDRIRGMSGNNFQSVIGDILSIYYQNKNLTYEMPAPYGGDDKNDGWVEEEALFYQIYGPTQLKSSLETSMNKKFEEDLSGLLDLIINKNKWNGKINKFIFIVQTYDNKLPKDSKRFYSKKVEELCKKFNINVEYEIRNIDYIEDLLFEIEDEKILKRMNSRIRTYKKATLEDISQAGVINLIQEINTKIVENNFKPIVPKTDYNRVDINKKINLNELESKKEEIINIHKNLHLVEEAVAKMQGDIKQSENFIDVKNWVITLYKEREKKPNEIDIYNEILKEIIDCTDFLDTSKLISEYILVYIFNQCDIFKKV